MGPQEKSPSLNVGSINDTDDDTNDSILDNEKDSYWNLDTRQAKRDIHDLRVFRRVHISSSHNPPLDLKRSYVFFDIEIGSVNAGRIIFELVRSLYYPVWRQS